MRKLLAIPALLAMALAAGAQTANSGYPETQLQPDYAADTGAANVLTVTVPSCPSALATGMLIRVKPNNANTTTTPTLNVCGLGAKTIVKLNSAALASGDIVTSAIALFVYDGTNMQLQNPQNNFGGTISAVNVSGPITGGGSSGSVTVGCSTCATSASSLASGGLVTGAGSQGLQTDSGITVGSHIFTLYDNISTAGLGMGVVEAVSDVTAQTASQSTVNLISSTGAAGHYMVRLYVDQNALCTTGTRAGLRYGELDGREPRAPGAECDPEPGKHRDQLALWLRGRHDTLLGSVFDRDHLLDHLHIVHDGDRQL